MVGRGPCRSSHLGLCATGQRHSPHCVVPGLSAGPPTPLLGPAQGEGCAGGFAGSCRWRPDPGDPPRSTPVGTARVGSAAPSVRMCVSACVSARACGAGSFSPGAPAPPSVGSSWGASASAASLGVWGAGVLGPGGDMPDRTLAQGSAAGTELRGDAGGGPEPSLASWQAETCVELQRASPAQIWGAQPPALPQRPRGGPWGVCAAAARCGQGCSCSERAFRGWQEGWELGSRVGGPLTGGGC